MAHVLNPEPADPEDRQAQHLPPKSYADAAEEGLNGHGGIDEDSIKETPPRQTHARKGSEPRPLGEMLAESDEHLPLPSTPTPIPRKPVPNKSFADAAAEPTPPTSNETDTRGRQDRETEHHEYTGQGLDASPKSPIRKVHKRISSRTINGGSKDVNGAAKEIKDGPQKKTLTNYESQEGEKLTSVKPPDGYEDALRQDKIERPKHERTKSELVSGRQAGKGWGESA